MVLHFADFYFVVIHYDIFTEISCKQHCGCAQVSSWFFFLILIWCMFVIRSKDLVHLTLEKIANLRWVGRVLVLLARSLVSSHPHCIGLITFRVSADHVKWPWGHLETPTSPVITFFTTKKKKKEKNFG